MEPSRQIRPRSPDILPAIDSRGDPIEPRPISSPAVPQIIVVQQPGPHHHQRPDRLPASGWFTRSFAVTAGYLTALLVFAGAGIALVFLACAGLLVSTLPEIDKNTRELKAENDRREAELRRREEQNLGGTPVVQSDLPSLSSPVFEPPDSQEPGPTPTASEYPYRTWSSRDGNFSTEAQFISRANKNVKLRKRDGTVITVNVDRLSEADEKWLGQPDAKRRSSE